MKENDLLLFFTVTAIALADIIADMKLMYYQASLTQLSVSLSTISTNRSFNADTTDVTAN